MEERAIRRQLWLRWTGGLLLSAAGCGDPHPASDGSETRPHILFVTVDTLRADRCSAYGYQRETTPRMSRLAAEGILFETAYAVTPTTAPSHATLFTARYPDEHGVRQNGVALPASARTLAEVLQDEGYETAAFVSSHPLREGLGLEQGFDVYDDFLHTPAAPYRLASATTEGAMQWLRERDSSRPFFLWVHYFDPHLPYLAPENYVRLIGRGERDSPSLRYDAEIRYVDEQLGRLRKAAAACEAPSGTLTVLTADHGEGLDDHGWWEHAVFLYEEAVRVPLILSWPGRIPPGVREAGVVSTLDVMPTLLALLGLDAAPQLAHGRDLSLAMAGEEEVPADGPAFLQRQVFETESLTGGGRTIPLRGAKWAVRKGRWKLIVAPEEKTRELFDLEADPGELKNLADDRSEVVTELLGALEDWRARQALTGESAEVLEADREALEALGYVRSP